MQARLADQIGRLIADACNGAAAETATGELLAEVDLWAARQALRRGALDEAAHVLFAAAARDAEPARKQLIAAQLVQVAKALGRRNGASEEDGAQAMAALRCAAEAAPVVGIPALAQLLRRQKRLPEAIEAYREAIRVEPDEPSHRLGLADLYEATGQVDQALATYLDLVERLPTARNYLVVSERLDELAPRLPAASTNQEVRLGLLGNATLDQLRSYVNVECYRAGLRPAIYQCGFDQYTQEILDAQSGLYAFAPDVLVCAVHPSRLFPDLHRYPFDLSPEQRRQAMEAGLGTVQRLLDAFTQRSGALVLFHNMPVPQHPALGILDLRDELGQKAIFHEINRRLAEMARERYRTVYVVDEDAVQARAGKAGATDARLWLSARLPWSESALLGLAKEYLRHVQALKGLTRKCVVLDLDNTLWGGVVGEDGVAGLEIGADAPGNAYVAFQQVLENLWKRGILLAICSKNNPDDALPVFEQRPEMVLKLSHFAALRVNWASKADNLRAIAQELNIGLDSLVFLDDNPVERARVRAELPQVLTPELPVDPAQYRAALLNLDVFESLALTEEDRNRNRLYAEQRARQDLEAQFATNGSLEEYLAVLEMVVDIEPADEHTLPRIAQLTNKTNQFNLTTRRYSEAQIREMIDNGCGVYGMRVTDRFGDNGLVGVAILRPPADGAAEIDTLLLSCRVMGRGVETALLAFLADEARAAGAQTIEGWYLPTAKNTPVQHCYASHGFTLVRREVDAALWSMDLAAASIASPTWLRVRVPALVA